MSAPQHPAGPPPAWGWGPYHHPWHPRRARFSRGGHRLFWFVLGGLAASWWMHRREEWYLQHGFCRRPDHTLAAPPPQQENAAQGMESHCTRYERPAWDSPEGQRHWRWGWHERREAEIEARRQREQAQAPDPVPAPRVVAAPQAAAWDHEKERIEDMKMKATEKVAEMSEATLDTILSTVNSLKAKLADQKAQMEEEKRRRQQEIEEQQKAPRHLV